MKNKYIINVFAILFLVLTTGCEDYLEEDPKGLLTPDTFFQNEEEANLALNGLHASIGQAGLAEHMGTDAGVCGRFAIAGGWVHAVYEYDPSNAAVRNEWTAAYSNIKNANLVLAGAEASSLPEEIKGNTIAQALFYRAYSYLGLTTTFGDVPYWRDEINMEEVALLGKTDANIIQTEMIEDLEWAISSGYLSTAKWNENNSRPTVWAVRMLKAYYHIWREEWPQAKAELVEITANSPHELSDDYADMYREGNELHDEIIFGREALTGIQVNRAFEQAHYNANAENEDAKAAMDETGVFAKSAALTLRKSFADTYDDNDIRKLYNVWEEHTLEGGTVAKFNYIYIPKLMRAAVPVEDPLMQNPDPNGQSSEPRRTFTLADAFLLLAEAEFNINGSSTLAVDALNAIRERTSLPLYTSITMEDIRNERGWELAAVGYWGRKKDLIRWGILEPTILALPEKEAAAGAYQIAIDRAQEEADRISGAPVGKFQVYPIPLDDILKSQDIGGALEQNPLWLD